MKKLLSLLICLLSINAFAKEPLQTKWAVNLQGDPNTLKDIQNPTCIDLSKQLGFTNYYYLTKGSDDAEAALVNGFASQVGAKIDIYFDMKNQDEAALDWMINTYKPEFIILNQESQNFGGNGHSFDTYLAPQEYIDLANHYIDYIGDIARPVLDCALVYKHNSYAVARQEAVATIGGAQDGRQYIQISPDIIQFGENMDENFTNLDFYFNNMSDDYSTDSLPDFLGKYKENYPNLAKEAVLQFHVEDTSFVHYVSPTPLGTWAIGKTIEFVLKNTSSFSYLAWMQWANLLHHCDTPNPEFYAMVRMGKMFKLQNVQNYRFNMEGVTGVLTSSSDGSRALLINNSSGTAYTIPRTRFKNLVCAEHCFTRDTGYSDSWGGVQINEVVQEDDVLIKKYSSSVVTYKRNR